MSPALSARLLIVLSICYGIAIAILGFLNSPAVGLVAMIGALVLGGLWAVRGMFASRSRSTD
jgi:hypothetical protein